MTKKLFDCAVANPQDRIAISPHAERVQQVAYEISLLEAAREIVHELVDMDKAPVPAPAPARGITAVQTYEGLANCVRKLSQVLATLTKELFAHTVPFPQDRIAISTLAKRVQEVNNKIEPLEAARKIISQLFDMSNI